MLHRIRLAVHVGSFDKLTGVVEADETFIGGLARNMHKAKREKVIKSRGTHAKTAVAGLLERKAGDKHSKIRAQVLPDIKRETLHALIRTNVETGSTVYSDAWQAYRQLGEDFVHDFVDHAQAYVKDKVVHTNGLENFWALFKRCIRGTHVNVEPFHLAAYVDSEAFRFNNRENKDGGRFVAALRGAPGKRLTYKALIGASEEAPESDSGAGKENMPN